MLEIIPNWHPLLVHFTIALFSISILLFIASVVFSGSEFGDNCLTAAKLNLWLGAGISILTGFAGLDAYNTVDHDTASHLAMTDHRNWAVATLIVFFIITAWTIVSKKIRQNPTAIFLVLLIIGGGLLMTTGFKGAETVYRYGLGVMSLPKVEGEGHSHSHGDGGGHGHGSKAAPKAMATPDDMDMGDMDSMDMGKDDGHAHEGGGDHAH